MKTTTLLSGMTLALAPGVALAALTGDDCLGTCQQEAASCCLSPQDAGTVAGKLLAPTGVPVALASVQNAAQRGMIGVYLADTDGPAVVEGLVDGGPAAKAGLKAGDRILAIGDKQVKSWNQIGQWIGSKKPGQRLSITVERDGWNKVVELTLAPAPAPPAQGVNAAEAPSAGYFFESDGPMSLGLHEVDDDEDHEHEHGDDDHDAGHVFSFGGGDGGHMVFGTDGEVIFGQGQGGKVHKMDLTDITEGLQGFTFDDGKAKVIIKGLKDGQMFDLEDLDIEMSDLHGHMDMEHLHEALSQLKGMNVEVDWTTDAKGDKSDKKADKKAGKEKQGKAKGIVVERLGRAQGDPGQTLHWVEGQGDVRVHVTGPDGGHNTWQLKSQGDGPSEVQIAPGQTLRGRILQERAQGQGSAPSQLRGRLLAPPGGGGQGRSNADLDALRDELQALRDELRELRQSLRRIQAGNRK